jgi:hypothetical protein
VGWDQRPVLKRGLPALLLVVPAVALPASTGIVQAVEECRLEPGVTAPSASKWRYRIHRDHHRCWFLSSSAGHRSQPHSSASARNRHVSGDPAAGQQAKQRNSDLQIASVPTSSDIPLTAESPAVQHAAPTSVEQSSQNLAPRSVPTIAYRVPAPSASTVLGPTALAAHTVQPMPASSGNSNVILLVGATAGLLFAGGVFHFARRGLQRPREHRVAGRHVVRVPLVVRRSVAASPPSMTTDWVDDLRRKVRELNRERPDANLPLSHQRDAVTLPDASTWLRRPKAKPIVKQISRQLADA